MTTSGGFIVTPQPEASDIGARILREGGNAFDAAIATAFAQGVVDPHRCGIGGFGVALVREANSGRIAGIDFHARAGSRASETMWADLFESASADGYGFLVRGKVNDVGPRSIAIPGMVRGMQLLHRSRARLPWHRLLEPAIALAEEGFVVPQWMAEYWRRPGLAGRPSAFERISLTPAGRRHALKPDGQPYAAGERKRLPALAAAYRRLAEAGPDDFYEGEIARTLLAELGDAPLFTPHDLAAYRAREEEPIRIAYRGFDLWSSPPPAGGVPLFQLLRMIEKTGATRLGHNTADYVDRVAGFYSRLHDARARTVGDPRFFPCDARRLLSDAWLDDLLARPIPTVPPGESHGTTQITAVDREGNAVSLAHSLGYDSGVFSDAYGFPFNNSMNCFDPRPGRPDSIRPGKARYTPMAPVVGFKDGEMVLVTGGPGGARITGSVGQSLVNMVDFGMSPQAAVEAQRFDAVGREVMFGAGLPAEIEQELQRRGWKTRRSPRLHGAIARAYPLFKTASGWQGGVDPAESGAFLAV